MTSYRNNTPYLGFEHQVVKAPAAKEFTDHLSQAYDNLVKAHACIQIQTDQGQSDVLAYAVSDQVWLSMDNLCLPHTSWKLLE